MESKTIEERIREIAVSCDDFYNGVALCDPLEQLDAIWVALKSLRYEVAHRPRAIVVSEESSDRLTIDRFPGNVDLGGVYRVEFEDSAGTKWTFVSALCSETRQGSVEYSVEQQRDRGSKELSFTARIERTEIMDVIHESERIFRLDVQSWDSHTREARINLIPDDGTVKVMRHSQDARG